MGLEIVVRPLVSPNIRPAPARLLPPEDNPEQGFAVISGNGAKQISLSYSYSASTSGNKHKEVSRVIDKVRIYQMDDDKVVNRDNFVDIEIAKKIRTDMELYDYAEVEEADNIEILARNKKIERRT